MPNAKDRRSQPKHTGRRAMRLRLRSLLVLAFGIVLPATASAQEVSVSTGLYFATYGGDWYADAEGGKGGEFLVRLRHQTGAQVGVGFTLGAFDQPVLRSDPSLTALSIFAEPAWSWRAGPVRPFAGGRVSWEHEFVGPDGAGLRFGGWGAGPTAGVQILAIDGLLLGVQMTWQRLHIGRDEASFISLRPTGQRFQTTISAALSWGQ
jgi:hypothetical protein